MSPPRPPALGARLLELLPLVAAFNVNAVAHHRFALALPLEAALGFMAFRGLGAVHSSRRMLLAGGGLALIALVLQLLGALPPPPPGPVPPLILGPLCAGLMGLAAFCALSKNLMYSSIYAWMLAVLSVHVKPDAPLAAMLIILAVAALASAFAESALWKQGAVGALLFCAFAAAVAGGTVVLTRVLLASEGMLMQAFASLGRDLELRPGVGLEDSVLLRARSTVVASPRPMLELSGPLPARLRTTVHDRFDGRRWTASAELDRDFLSDRGPPGAEVENQLVMLEELAPFLPVPAGTLSISGAAVEPRPAGLYRSARLRGQVLRLRRSAREEEPESAPPSAALIEVPAELAGDLARHALALTPGATTPRQIGERLEAYFRDGFLYSLSTDLAARGRHPLLVLIEDKRPAYCVWFASAMALLLRAHGVPARVASGFAIGEVNPLTGVAVVRERDAHAWVEAWLPTGAARGRWTAFDPTPWRSRDAELGIDRNPGLLAQLFSALVAGGRRIIAAPGVLLEVARSPVALALLVLFLSARLWRTRGSKGAKSARLVERPVDPRLRTAYRDYLRVLAKGARLAPLAAETDDELLARLRAARGETAAEAARRFLSRYRAARFGSGPTGTPLAPELAALRRALQAPVP